MKYILLIILIALINFQISPVFAQDKESVPLTVRALKAEEVDRRVTILKDYLATHKSPLEGSAKDFVEAADQYELDWKLVASISGVESTFGKRIPGGYNGWGWGVYGTQAIYFNSWEDAIYTISKGLKEDYISRGLTDPYKMNTRYAASPAWGWKVSFFMNEIDEFSKKYPAPEEILVRFYNIEAKTVTSSAKLTADSTN